LSNLSFFAKLYRLCTLENLEKTMKKLLCVVVTGTLSLVQMSLAFIMLMVGCFLNWIALPVVNFNRKKKLQPVKLAPLCKKANPMALATAWSVVAVVAAMVTSPVLHPGPDSRIPSDQTARKAPSPPAYAVTLLSTRAEASVLSPATAPAPYWWIYTAKGIAYKATWNTETHDWQRVALPRNTIVPLGGYGVRPETFKLVASNPLFQKEFARLVTKYAARQEIRPLQEVPANAAVNRLPSPNAPLPVRSPSDTRERSSRRLSLSPHSPRFSPPY
jgi:hypothetical protein